MMNAVPIRFEVVGERGAALAFVAVRGERQIRSVEWFDRRGRADIVVRCWRSQ